MIQSGGAISLVDLQTEFGGGYPISLNEYYKGGTYVSSSTTAGEGSFQTAPLTPDAGPIEIPTSGGIQLSHFYGTQDLIIGNSGLITAPVENYATSDYVDVTLPAGVNYIRFYLLGGGGGGGGKNGHIGGNGGAGSFISSVISTSWAGPINVNRTLRLLIGRGGAAGFSANGNSITNPAPRGGSGYPMNATTSSLWGTFLNTYAVKWDMRRTGQASNDVPRGTRMVQFPSSGNYVFQFAADNYMRVYLDGVEVANTYGMNDQAFNGNDSYTRNTTNPLTKTVSITAGLHKLSFANSNSGSSGGYGLRILNGTTQIWTTRYAYASNDPSSYPCGGNGGYAGSSGGSGYGGAGGAATRLSIIHPQYGEFFIACAGGGGGGGGGGDDLLATISKNANWATQGYDVIANPRFVAGDDGEFIGAPNRGSTEMTPIASDGGGGGGGGGGIENSRMYYEASLAWLYSGFGGRTRRAQMGGDDDADGGESGKSAITSNGSRNAFVHSASRSTTPHLASGIPVSFAGYGVGGAGQDSVAAVAGTGGCAYIDWGVANQFTPAPSISYSALTASILPFDIATFGLLPYGGNEGVYLLVLPNTPFVLDGFGGGGRPGSNYSYTWTRLSGDLVTFSASNSHRTTVFIPDEVITSGVIRLTVSDGFSTATRDISWGTGYFDTGGGGG